MSKSFDEILKKGKQAANHVDPKEEWKFFVTRIMFELHHLNSLYNDTDKHYISVERQRCSKCKEATFILCVRDWDDRTKELKFHKGSWKALDSGKYLCEKCK